MQKYKKEFEDISYQETFINIQPCLRLNDLEEIGDGTHYLYFRMIGMFSFRELSLEQTIDFWLEFIEDELKLQLSKITIHPKKEDWRRYYSNQNIELDETCTWTDGELGGYCTEFYVNDIEIGNIVNTRGDCIDVGFGFERLLNLVYDIKPKPKEEILKDTCLIIINSGIKPSGTKHGYVLRKLLRTMVYNKYKWDHPLYLKEIERSNKMYDRYLKLSKKHFDKDSNWWWETHGIDLDIISSVSVSSGPFD
jgi:alanyl-tRNA synthetase